MKTFPQATPPAPLKTEHIRPISLFYAVMLIVMAVGQLFSFEKFIPLIDSFDLPGGQGMGTLVAGLIVVAEVFALPFLIRMRVSPLMRWLSVFFAGLVPLLWVLLSIWLNVTMNAIDNVGFVGVKIEAPVGWWAVLYSMALGVLAAWSIWGMWPGKATVANTVVKKSKARATKS